MGHTIRHWVHWWFWFFQNRDRHLLEPSSQGVGVDRLGSRFKHHPPIHGFQTSMFKLNKYKRIEKTKYTQNISTRKGLNWTLYQAVACTRFSISKWGDQKTPVFKNICRFLKCNQDVIMRWSSYLTFKHVRWKIVCLYSFSIYTYCDVSVRLISFINMSIWICDISFLFCFERWYLKPLYFSFTFMITLSPRSCEHTQFAQRI